MLLKKYYLIPIFLLFSKVCLAASYQNIDNDALIELMDRNVPLVDVRATSEWKQTGIIEDSHLLMFYDEQGKFDLKKWLNDIKNIANKDEPVILICLSGGRSKQLAKYLTRVEGYSQVYNVKKGIGYWKRKKHPTVPPKL